MVPIGDLRPNAANPNKQPTRQLEIYAAAIRAHGWRESVTVSKLSGLVVRGHGALLAARLIGASSIPVEFQEYGSSEEELADLLADNRLAHLATTDAELLKSALQILTPAAITGYSGTEIAELLAELAPPPEFPIAAKLNERHDYIVIVVDNETDWQFLKNLAGVRTERSFKNNMIGEGRAIPFPRFLESLRENLHSILSPRGDDLHSPARA
jgi:ParB-like chromosome segregation protein Spo0J